MIEHDFKKIEDAILNEPAMQVGDIAVKELYPTKPYIYALQKALYQGIYTDLYKLFNSKAPIHPEFLPVITTILMRSKTKDGGSPPIFTPTQQACIHKLVSERCLKENISIHKACLAIEALSCDQKLLDDLEIKKISVGTIRRAFDYIDKELFDNSFTNRFNG